MIRLSCPACRSLLKAADEKAGKRVQCPHCGQKFIVPQHAPFGATKSEKYVPEAPPAPRPDAPDRAGSRFLHGLVLAIDVLVVSGFWFTIGVLYFLKTSDVIPQRILVQASVGLGVFGLYFVVRVLQRSWSFANYGRADALACAGYLAAASPGTTAVNGRAAPCPSITIARSHWSKP